MLFKMVFIVFFLWCEGVMIKHLNGIFLFFLLGCARMLHWKTIYTLKGVSLSTTPLHPSKEKTLKGVMS